MSTTVIVEAESTEVRSNLGDSTEVRVADTTVVVIFNQ
jgi:hypothetical protein